ncbi:MAG: hypothetical protein EBU70_13265, partial [Actinobacteria bacterium]|nr:hypothetical protein [Actinomycetota bacterium]
MDLPADQPPGRTSAPATELGAITAELRAAVADAVDSAVPPGSGARSVGRSLGLTKTMGWKLWTLATSDDAER